MFDHETFNSLHVENTADDPVIALIAEYYRKEELARDAEARADEVEFALPQDVRYQRPKIVVGYLRIHDGEPQEEYATDEARIDSFLPPPSSNLLAMQKVLGIAYTPRADRAALVAELHAEQARVDAAYKMSGHAALVEQVAALNEQAEDVLTEIEETLPVSLAGVEALLELRRYAYDADCDDEILGNVVDWLRFVVRARP